MNTIKELVITKCQECPFCVWDDQYESLLCSRTKELLVMTVRGKDSVSTGCPLRENSVLVLLGKR